MSTSNHLGEFWRQPFKCRWSAFESDAYSLQRDGWEFVQELSPYHHNPLRDEVTVIAKHKPSGVTMWGRAHACIADYGHSIGGEIEFTGMRQDAKVELRVYGQLPKFQRVDMAPSHEPITRRTLHIEGIFKPAAEREIIVAPDEVADLLERITKLQQPELLAIRERNRAREARDRAPELFHATILSIAA